MLTFVPPVFIVSLYPEIFILALSYAGLLVVVLSVLLPASMVWSGRYVTGVAKDYRVWGCKVTIMAEVGAGLLILSIGLLEGLGLLKWV